MKLRASRLSSIFVLVLALAASTRLPAAVPTTTDQADVTPTVVVQAIQPSHDVTSTIVVTASKNGGNASQPMVLFVMLLFGSVLLLLRRYSRGR